MAEPLATVAVCTRDRPASLERTLRSLVADGSSIPRELVVVDNGSSAATAAVVEEIRVAAPFEVVLTAEPRPGLSHARNRAVEAARGELVLWTDDDVEVEDGWADALAAPFDDRRVAAAGGRILPRWEAPPPGWMAGPHAVHVTLPDYGLEPRRLQGLELPVGANMAIRASVLRRFGQPFSPQLGQRGASRIGYEEAELFARLGPDELIVYTPAAVVHHWVGAERVDWDWMRRAWYQGGFGLARWERRHGDPFPTLPRRAVRAARTLRGAHAIRRANLRRGRGAADDAWREFHAFMWAGKHLEMLVGGRFPRLSTWMSERLAG